MGLQSQPFSQPWQTHMFVRTLPATRWLVWTVMLALGGLAWYASSNVHVFVDNTWPLNLALLMTGVGLSSLDIVGACARWRWLHHSETLFRAVTACALFWSLQQAQASSWMPIFHAIFFLVAYCLLCNYGCYLPDRTFHHVCLGLVLMGLFTLTWFIVQEFVRWPSQWTLFGLFFVGHLALSRQALWFDANHRLSKGQHQDIWPRLAHIENSSTFWRHVHAHTTLYNDLPNVVAPLPLKTLLDFFIWSKAPDSVGMDAAKMQDYIEHIKSAVTQREPRALVVWEMFGLREAVNLIEQLDCPKVHVDEVPLPAL